MKKASQNQAVSLLSGGLDSSVATVMAWEEFEIIRAITFDYGQRAALREIQAARTLCDRLDILHEVISLPWLAGLTTTALVQKGEALPRYQADELGRDRGREEISAQAVWVPNRNGVFLSIAAAVAESFGAEIIIAGFNREEATTFPDNSESFIAAFNQGLSFSTRNQVRVMSPTAAMTKVEIVNKALELDLNVRSLWSCYEGGAEPCGTCESCARTLRALKAIEGTKPVRPAPGQNR